MRTIQSPTTNYGMSAALLEPQDTTRINIKDQYQIQFYTGRFGVSQQRLLEAVAEVGPSVWAVRIFLQGQSIAA